MVMLGCEWRKLSHGTAQKAYLQQVYRINALNGQSPFTTGSVSGHEEVPLDVHLKDKLSDNHLKKKQKKAGEPTQPTHIQPNKRSNLFGILVAAIVLSTVLFSLLIWISYPASTVSAVDHSSQRLAGDLVKPSLTPTKTPEPTSTPTATDTQEPPYTATPEPGESPESQYKITIPAPELPLNIAEGERWIDVDLTHQRTYAYEGSTLIRTFIVSTGTQYHPTVTGQYHIYVKYRYDDMAGPGYYLPDVPYTMYFYKGYSLHGTYWHNNFGQPMSHGCVNMATPDAEWLFYWASVGTLVNVHY